MHWVDGLLTALNSLGKPMRTVLDSKSRYKYPNYGANGFHLDFSDPADIGADRAPIDGDHTAANNFNDNGFELGDNTSVDWDHMEDHPTQNWATQTHLVQLFQAAVD